MTPEEWGGEVEVGKRRVWRIGGGKAQQDAVLAVFSGFSLRLNYCNVATNTLRKPSVV